MNEVTSIAEQFSFLKYIMLVCAALFLWKAVHSIRGFYVLRRDKDVPYNNPTLERFSQNLKAQGYKAPPYGVYATGWMLATVFSLGLWFWLR